MGVVVKHVQADRKTGRLMFRRTIPASLRTAIPGRPRESVRTLKSKQLDAAAMALYNQALEEFERVVSTARKAVSGSFDSLDAPRIAWLVETYAAGLLADDERQRILGLADRESHEANEMGHASILEDCTGPEIRTIFEADAVGLAHRSGWHFDTQSEAFATLCYGMLKARVGVAQAQLARDNGLIVDTPQAPSQAPLGRAEDTAAPTSFEGIATAMLGNLALGISATTGEAWRTALRFLREAFGPLAPRQLSRRHAAELRDLLTERPARPAKDARRMALRDLVEAHKERSDVARLSGVTVRQHLRSLSTIWTRAQEEGFIAEPLTNPFKGVRVNVEAAPDNPQELSRDELLAMFGTPVFTEGERPAGGRGEAAFWLPLLAFFTGARPEEVAQLMVSDTFRDDQGRLCLKISGEGEAHPAKGKRTLKTRKTRTGVRQFPLPNGLIGLGFGEYVQWLKDRREIALFPLLTTRGNRGLHAGFSRWWSGYLRRNKASPQGDGRKPWREFRQCFSSAAIRGELSLEERNYLMGHAIDPGTASGHYGNRNPMGVAMLRVAFDESVVEHVTPWRRPCSVNDTK